MGTENVIQALIPIFGANGQTQGFYNPNPVISQRTFATNIGAYLNGANQQPYGQFQYSNPAGTSQGHVQVPAAAEETKPAGTEETKGKKPAETDVKPEGTEETKPAGMEETKGKKPAETDVKPEGTEETKPAGTEETKGEKPRRKPRRTSAEKVSVWNTELEKAKEKLAEHEERLATLEKDSEAYKKLETKIENVKKYIADLERNINQSGEKLLEKITGLQEEMNNMKANGQQGTEKFNKLQAEFEKATGEFNDLKTKVSELSKHSADHQSGLQRLSERMKVMEKQIDDVGTVVNDHTTKINLNDKKVGDLTTKVDDLTSRTDKIDEILKGHTESLHAKDEKIAALGKDIEELRSISQKQGERLKLHGQKIGDLTTKVDDLTGQLAKSKKAGRAGLIFGVAGVVAALAVGAIALHKSNKDDVTETNGDGTSSTPNDTPILPAQQDTIPPVQQDTIPPVQQDTIHPVQPEVTENQPQAGDYTVVNGDCVWNIAKKILREDNNGIDPSNQAIAKFTQKIIEENGMQGKWNGFVLITPGQKVKIPADRGEGLQLVA